MTKTKFETPSETVTACATCRRPVFWMAQHRECWQWEKAQGIAAPSQAVARRQKARRETVTVNDEEYREHMERFEAEAHAYAAAH